jgi:hypothetical protein
MNKIMFVMGIMIMVVSAVLFVFTSLPSAQITVLLIIGILLAAASKFRLLKT